MSNVLGMTANHPLVTLSSWVLCVRRRPFGELSQAEVMTREAINFSGPSSDITVLVQKVNT